MSARVGILLLSHGPLAEALRESVKALDPADKDLPDALSLNWDEEPERASRRLEKAIAGADGGAGVVVLTDMFGGTPSNLAMAYLDPGRIEIVTGMNLPMVVKAMAAARLGSPPGEIAQMLVQKGRRSIVAAAGLLGREGAE